MSKFKFGNFEAEIDPTDVAFVEKYEGLADVYNYCIAQISTEGKASEVLLQICNVFYDVFEGLFGKGSSGKMFGKTNSVDQCVKAFRQLIDMMNHYGKTLELLPAAEAKTAVTKPRKK